MSQEAPSKQGLNQSLHRGGRRYPNRDTPQFDKRQEPAEEKHLRQYPYPLPVSTRAVGLAVGQFMVDYRTVLSKNLSSNDDDYAYNEAYMTQKMPNLYQVYRRFLAAFEEKLKQIRIPFILHGSVHNQIYYGNSYGEIAHYENLPKHITEIVNALGFIDHEDVTFVPVVAKEVYDANRKLVPQPVNLLYSNLRRTVVALADPETPEPYRIEFEAYCPIPGAIWHNHLLMNADEIIPDNHVTSYDDVAFCYLPESLRGKLNNDTRGNISALVNINRTLDFKLPPREDGQALRDYNRCYSDIFRCEYIDDLTSFAKLTKHQRKQGMDVLIFGEVPNNADHKSTLYAIREKYLSAFNLPRYTYQDWQYDPICLTLSISTRGIGFHCSKFLQQIPRDMRANSNIYATYRAFLGLLEIKMKPNWLCTRVKPSEIYRSSFVRTNPNLTSTIVIHVPEAIEKIISAVGNITIGQRTFIMAMASERLDKNGKLIPEPQNLLISNLRRTVEALSDPETPLQHREHFEQNCPIPGAIWDNHLLTNANEIIPANYSAENLEADILAWVESASELMGRVEPHLAELKLNGGNALGGKRSAFVSVTMEHPLHVEARQVGQDPAAYRPFFQQRPRLDGRSFVWLTPEETAEGLMLLLGEWQKKETRPIYALRDPAVCCYEVVRQWDFFSGKYC